MGRKPFREKKHYTEFHDWLLDELMPVLSPAEWKIVCFILRKTEGWQKERDRLSYRQIMQGCGKGVKSQTTLSNALALLVDAEDEDKPIEDRNGVLLRFRGKSRPGKYGSVEYAINPEFDLDAFLSSKNEEDGTTPPSPKNEEESAPKNGEGASSKNGDTNTHRASTTLDTHNDNANALSGGSVEPPVSLEEKRKEKQKQQKPGQKFVAMLMERVKDKKDRGVNIFSPTDKERRSFAEFYKQALDDGHTEKELSDALDYMVAKAAGEVANEPKAWCGYHTALDVILTGEWKPEGDVYAKPDDEEHKKAREENDRMLAELNAMMHGGDNAGS